MKPVTRLEALYFVFVIVPINSVIWWCIPCEWSRPYGRTTPQSATPRVMQ